MSGRPRQRPTGFCQEIGWSKQASSPDFSQGGVGGSYSIAAIEIMLNMQKTECFREMPIPALAGPRAPGLALHSSGSDGYHFRSRAASRHTMPAPASGIPVRNPG